MQNSQLSTIDLSVNIVDAPAYTEESTGSVERGSVWARSGPSGRDLHLNTGEGEKHRFTAVTHNASSGIFYQQAGLESIVQKAVEGINVSMLFFGVPHDGTSTDRIEFGERTRALALTQKVLRTLMNCPERRERYCAAAFVQIDADGAVHPFDAHLEEPVAPKVDGTTTETLPFSLWHGDHGLVLPPEIFQEMSCQQDIDHFFTMHRVEGPVEPSGPKTEVVSLEDAGKDESLLQSQRLTFPHTARSTPRESALLFVAEVFQGVSSGHDKRSTVMLLYLPQRPDGTISQHLWSGFSSLLERGKLAQTTKSQDVRATESTAHPVSRICQHIVYGGGRCAAMFNLPSDEAQLSASVALLDEMKILRAAKLLLPINYYHMPKCATEAVSQFKQYQRMIKRDLRAAFAAGMHDGWQMGLKSVQAAVRDRKEAMHRLTHRYASMIREAALPRFQALIKGSLEDLAFRKRLEAEHDEAQAQSKAALEEVSQLKAQLDAIVGEIELKARAVAEADRQEALAVQEIDRRLESGRSEVEAMHTEIASVDEEIKEIRAEIERTKAEKARLEDAEVRAVAVHSAIFDVDFTAQVERERKKREEAIEQLRALEAEHQAMQAARLHAEANDPTHAEIHENALLIQRLEDEVDVIEAQIAIHRRSQMPEEIPETPAKGDVSPSTVGDLSRILAPPTPSPQQSAVKDAQTNDFFDDEMAMHNISLLIEQSPFDPTRLKKSDFEGPRPKALFQDAPARGFQAQVQRTMSAANRQAQQSHPQLNTRPKPVRKAPVRIPKALQAAAAENEVKQNTEDKQSPVTSRLRSSVKGASTFVLPKQKPLPRMVRTSQSKTKRKSLKAGSTSSSAPRKSKSRPSKRPREAPEAKPKTAAPAPTRPAVNPPLSKVKPPTTKPASAAPFKVAQKVPVKKPVSASSSATHSSIRSTASKSLTIQPSQKFPPRAVKSTSIVPDSTRTVNKRKVAEARPKPVVKKPPAKATSQEKRETKPPAPQAKPKPVVKKPAAKESSPVRDDTEQQGDDSNSPGAVILRKSAKKVEATVSESMMLDVSAASPAKPAQQSPLEGHTSRKLVQPADMEESPGRMGGNIGAIIRNFIQGSASALKNTVSPRALDFAEKSTDMFSFLHEASDSSPTEVSPVAEPAPTAKRASATSSRKSKKGK